jgi:sugar/nucleoside kinase (ribokinase family)
MGPKYVVIVRGEHGALIFHDRMFSAPALPLEEVFDPTGAGDICRRICGYLTQSENISLRI